MSMTVGAATIPSTFYFQLETHRASAPTTTRTRTAVEATLTQALQVAGQAELWSDASSMTKRALQKLTLGCRALSTSSSLENAMAKILIEQSKQSDQRSDLARQTVEHTMSQRIQQTRSELTKILERIEAERNAGFWDGLVNIFKGIAAAFSAASSVFTGPAGATGAGLLVASIIVSYAAPGEAGKWISLGLSLAGAAFSAGASIWGEVAKGSAKLAQSALSVGEALGNGAMGACTIARGVAESEALDAEADIAEIRAMCKKLMDDAEEAREELQLVVEAQDKGVKVVLQALNEQHEISISAIREGIG